MKALLISTFFIILIYTQNASLCLKYNSFNTCENCEEKSYLFEDNKCRYTANKQGCAIYTISQMKIVCAQCLNGYHLSDQVCKRSIPNCIKQNQSICLTCNSGFKLAGNECISLTSRSSLPAHCTELSSSRVCSACQQGYSIKKQQCVLNSLVCNITQIFKGCLFTENGQCVTCKPNYMLSGGRCKQITIPNCLSVNNSVCVRCEIYYSLVNGNCVNEYSRSILNCLRSQSYKCVQCIPGFALVNSTCVKSTQQIQVRAINSFVIYTQIITQQYSNKWYIYCLSFQSGICKSCQKSYMLNQDGECIKDLSLMKKFSLISVSTSFLNSSISEYWQFDSSQSTSLGRQIWYQMTSTSIVTLWGITIKSQTAFSARGLFIVYQTESGEWVCFDNCKVKSLIWNSNNLFQWVFSESIKSRSIRIYFIELTGKVSAQIQGYYQDPLSTDSSLVSVWSSANLYSSLASSSAYDYKISQVSVNGGLSLQTVSYMYAGFNLTVEGVVRVRKIIISAGSPSNWVTSFILKYSMDGINFYCVDGCSSYNGVSNSGQFAAVTIKNPVYARYIIVIPILYKTSVSIRFDFLYDSSLSLTGCLVYSIDGKCKICKSDYDLTNGVCKIKFAPVAGCKTMNPNTGYCILCEDGYYLNSSGKCPLKLPGCIYTGSQCTSCIEGYSLSNSVCTIPNQYLLRMSLIGVKLYSSIGAGSSPLFTDDCKGKGGWIPRVSDAQQWVIMSTSDTLKIYKLVITTGSTSWLQSFNLYYSSDMSTWTQYTSPILFSVNTESQKNIVEIYLTPYITAKSIKIVPVKWGSKGINFNFQAYYYFHKSRGEYYDQNNLTFKSFNDLADVFFSQKVVITEMNTRIGDNGCFTLPSSPNQYLQLSLDEFEDQIANVTTMYVRGSNLRKAWVTSLYFMYSKNYGSKFVCYKNCTPIVTGLTGPDDLKKFELEGLDNITDIKVYPLTWENANSIRIEFAMK